MVGCMILSVLCRFENFRWDSPPISFQVIWLSFKTRVGCFVFRYCFHFLYCLSPFSPNLSKSKSITEKEVKTAKENWTRKIDHVDAFQVYRANYWGLDHIWSLIWEPWNFGSAIAGHKGIPKRLRETAIFHDVCATSGPCGYDMNMHEHHMLDIQKGNKTGQKVGKTFSKR